MFTLKMFYSFTSRRSNIDSLSQVFFTLLTDDLLIESLEAKVTNQLLPSDISRNSIDSMSSTLHAFQLDCEAERVPGD